jgi:hypothetical protein
VCSFHAFLHILQTTLKSKLFLYLKFRGLSYFRMLMACLRYLALCSCARCLVLKSRIPMIGSKRDIKQRIQHKRVDSQDRRRKVERARKLMFEGGINITSEKVEEILRPTSLTPTRVCAYYSVYPTQLIISLRMRFRNAFSFMGSIFTKCLFQISCTNLSWGSGKRFLHISYAFYMHVEKTRFRY